MKILMVCLGNICRSPMAHGILQHVIDEKKLDWQVDSAGTNGYHNGEPPHRFSIKECKKNGIDISNQISRRFTVADFENYDRIYVMANDVYNDVLQLAKNASQMQKVSIFLNELYADENKDVIDPWYGDEAGYEPVYDEIYKCCEAIVNKYYHPLQ
jgi:protein-tyrosine phosphatase